MRVRVHYSVFIVILLISSTSLCFALDGEAARNYMDREQYMPIAASCFRKLVDLKPWFNQIEESISDSSKNEHDLEILRAKLANNNKVSLRLRIKMNGELDGLSVLKTSGIETVDQTALEIVAQSAPFLKPPNDLIEKGVLLEVQFVKTDKTLKVKASSILPSDFGMPKFVNGKSQPF